MAAAAVSLDEWRAKPAEERSRRRWQRRSGGGSEDDIVAEIERLKKHRAELPPGLGLKEPMVPPMNRREFLDDWKKRNGPFPPGALAPPELMAAMSALDEEWRCYEEDGNQRALIALAKWGAEEKACLMNPPQQLPAYYAPTPKEIQAVYDQNADAVAARKEIDCRLEILHRELARSWARAHAALRR